MCWSTSEGAGTSPGHADSEERLGDWDGHPDVFAPLCSPKRSTRPSGEWGQSTRYHMLGRECPEAVLPGRSLYLPTLSDLLIVNKLLSHTHTWGANELLSPHTPVRSCRWAVRVRCV